MFKISSCLAIVAIFGLSPGMSGQVHYHPTGRPWDQRASAGPDAEVPGWYYNLKADANVEIRDGASVQSMVVREIVDQTERDRLFSIAVSVWPPYQEYKEKTDRRIPIFIAEPQSE